MLQEQGPGMAVGRRDGHRRSAADSLSLPQRLKGPSRQQRRSPQMLQNRQRRRYPQGGESPDKPISPPWQLTLPADSEEGRITGWRERTRSCPGTTQGRNRFTNLLPLR